MPELTTEIGNVMMDDVTAEDLTTSATSSPTPYGKLNCGYECSRYFYSQPITKADYDALTTEEREAIKKEYYKSYDYMTGIRTAEFLGGAILLFSMFVLYKMKCRPVRGRKMSVMVNKMSSENASALVPTVPAPELTSSPDIVLSEVVNDKDSGCQNGSASTTLSTSRRGSARLEMVKPVHLTRFNAGRLSCGNINGPPSVFLKDSLLRPSSVQCMPLGSHFLQQQPSFNRLPVHLRTSDQSNEIIDIRIIQPTPNMSPRESIRRLSVDNEAVNRRLSTLTHSIPKSQSCLQTALSSGRSGARKPAIKPRRLSLSPGDCYSSYRIPTSPSSHAQNADFLGSCSSRVIPNSPSTPLFGSTAIPLLPTTSSTLSPLVDLMGQSRLGARRLSTKSVVDEVAGVHRPSSEGRRASTDCHVSWLPVASRQTVGLPLDVSCVMLESEDKKISETTC